MATGGSSMNANLPKTSTSLKEGFLEKRQRGQSHSANPKRLKFQHRYICLTQDNLEYFVDQKRGDKKPAGVFSVDRIRIIEKVPDATFQKSYCFQVGDENEVMYLSAKSDSERRHWMEALRIAANLKKNAMLERYHLGAYGHVCRKMWSCCNAADRDAPGCQETSMGCNPRRMTTPSSSSHSKSSSKGAHRPYTSCHGRLSANNQRSANRSLKEEPDPSSFHSQSAATCSSPLSNLLEQEDATTNTLEEDSDIVDDSKETVSTMHHTGTDKDEGTDIDSNTGLPLVHIPNSHSIESGIGGSIHSLSLIQSKSHQDKIPDQEPKQHGQTKKTVPWKYLDSSTRSSVSEVASAVFRGTNALITAHKDGPVQVFDTGKLERGGFQLISSTDVFGSVDTWKNYVAIGFLNLQLLKIDNTLSFLQKVLLRQNQSGVYHPYLVVFTPRGQLLSYNQSQPNTITLWPQVESLWSAQYIESEGCLSMEDASGVESLLVSPNPNQPWLAVGVSSPSSPKQLRIYDYATHKLKNKFNLAEKEKTVASFTPSGEYIAIGRQRSLMFHGIDSKSPTFSFPEFDTPITSLAHNLWSRDDHIVIGFSNGNIDVYNGLTGSPKLLMSLDDKEARSGSVTCLAYSNDGQTLAAGSSDGIVKLWKVPGTSKSGSKTVSLVREGEITVDSKGIQHVLPDDGYTISLPSGAIAEGKTVTFKYGVVPDGPFGPFQFPNGVRPVSAILSLHPTTEEPLLKPIEIALPHFIHCETQEDQKRLAVYKADCHSDVREGADGRTLYSFKKMTGVKLSLGIYNGDPNYPEGIPYAKFSTGHCCYLCIGEYGKDDTDRAIFSLVEAKPKTLNQFEELVVHFCLPYFLPTCHMTIREQYPEDRYNLSIQSVKFSSDADVDDPAIGINFRKQLGDWFFSLQGGDDKKIYQNEVCFWEYPTPLYLKEMCEEKLYPPRFSVLVRGPVRPDDVIKADFTFPGADMFPGRGEPVATVYFPLQSQRSSTVSSGSRVSSVVSVSPFRAPVTTLSVSSPSQQSLQPAARAFKACMSDLDKLHPSQLALNLISSNLIDDADFESIQESMRSATKDEMVIRSEILWKIYSALKADASLYTPLHKVLLKLNPESAGKFASEMRRLSSDGSVASIVTTPQENVSNESENLADSDTVFVENGMAPASEASSSTLTTYSPMQFPENLPGLLTFNTLSSSTQTLTQSDISHPLEESPEET